MERVNGNVGGVNFTAVEASGEDELCFECSICARRIMRSVAVDVFPICMMCRWFCSVDGRWGRDGDGIRGWL